MPRSTNLWQLIERIQRGLEAEGLDDRVIDVAVLRGLEAWLTVRPRRARTRA
jgi:hypothetical protein